MKRWSALIASLCLLLQAAAFAADPPATNPPAKPAAKAPAKPAARPAAGATRDRPAIDRLQLDPTAITGNRELPKVMSIVPWKGAEPPGGPDRPMGSLVEEVLSPLDRDEFRREITYYRDLTSQSSTVVAPGASQP